MIRVVMDTSSLLSLELTGILKKFISIAKITIPIAVKAELEEIGKYNDKKSNAAKNILEMIKNDEIETAEIKDTEKADNLLSKNVNRGEAECFVCCIENGIRLLVMDDVDAAYYLEGPAIADKIKIKISVAAMIELYKKKAINRNEMKKSVQELIKIREWEGGVLEVLANKYLKNM